MAGAGVKLFLSGEIAYAADINQYLMDQSVALFLNEAARNSAFGNGIPITQAGGDGKPLLTAGRICFLLEAAGSTVGNPIRTIQYYDGSTWVDSGQFTVPDGAVTSAKLNAGVAGSGLSGGAGTALAVNVDGSTIEINSDTLRVGNPAAGTTSTGASGFGYMGLPQNANVTGAYPIVASDAGKHIYSTATRTVTIPANASIAMPIGSTLVFIAGSGATVTIAITSDTMYLAGPGTTGSRILAPFGMATAVKITATSWIISGNGLT